MSGLVEMLKGPTGSFDIGRIGLFGSLTSSIFAPLIFQSWALLNGQNWSPAEFCAGYGALLAGVLSLGGLGIATKDKGVASALNTTAPAPPEGGQP